MTAKTHAAIINSRLIKSPDDISHIEVA